MDEFAFLDEVLAYDEVVSASKHRQSIFWSPSSVTVFTREDIRASGARNIADLLRRVPGFDVYRLKPGYPVLGARAQTDEHNNQVLLLVDGREDLVELTGFAFWNSLAIDLAEVERIEVIRGPGSALYGANAFTAVVNVTTLAERPATGADVHLSGGEGGFQRHFGRVRITHDLQPGLISASVGYGFEESLLFSNPGEPANTGSRVHGTLRYQQPGGLDVSLHAGMAEGSVLGYIMLGDMGVSNLFAPWVMAQASFELSEGYRLRTQLYFYRFEADLHARVTVRAWDLWIADLPDMDWVSNTADAQFQLEMDLAEWLLGIVGGNLRYSSLDSYQILLDDDDEIRGALFVHTSWQPTVGDQSLPVQLTAGIRLDLNDSTGFALSPRIAAVYRPQDNQSFRVTYGMAFRKPSFLESRTHIRIEDYNQAIPEIVPFLAEKLANPDLKNEQVGTLEIGWRGSFLQKKLDLALDFFYSHYQDIILIYADVPTPGGIPNLTDGTLEFTNDTPESKTLGGEVEASWQPASDWTVWCNLGLRYSMVDDVPRYVLKEPTLRANLGGRYLPDSGWVVDAALHYVSTYSMRLAVLDNLVNMAPNLELGNQVVFIGRLGRKLSGPADSLIEIGLEINTPLGARFREYAGMSMPQHLSRDTLADWGGEYLERRIGAYLRASL